MSLAGLNVDRKSNFGAVPGRSSYLRARPTVGALAPVMVHTEQVACVEGRCSGQDS